MDIDEALTTAAVRMKQKKDERAGWELGAIALSFAIKMLYKIDLAVVDARAK